MFTGRKADRFKIKLQVGRIFSSPCENGLFSRERFLLSSRI